MKMIKKWKIYLVIILATTLLITLRLIVKVKVKAEVFKMLRFTECDKELGWRLRSGYSDIFYIFDFPFNNEIKINSIGIRGEEIMEDLKNKFVILCIGDSTTFGWGLDIYDTYPYMLEQEINAKKLSVLNCGVPGYNSSQIKKYFINNLAKFNPYLVIIMGGVNDTIVTHHFFWNFAPPFFIRKQIFKYNLISLINIFKQNKIKVIFITVPILGQWKEVDAINETIRNVCNRMNVNLVDIAKVFKEHESKDLYAEVDKVYKIYFHPSKKGNRIIVQQIIAEMKKMGIL